MNIQFTRLDHVALVIPEGTEAEARHFYTDILKLKEEPKPDSLKSEGGMWFNIADVQIHLSIGDPLSSTKRHPAFQVQNVQQIKEYLESHGVKTTDHRPIPGIARFSFYDPFGNRIELLEKSLDQ